MTFTYPEGWKCLLFWFIFFWWGFYFVCLCMGGFENNLIMLGVNICYGSAKRQLVLLWIWSLLSRLRSEEEKRLCVCVRVCVSLSLAYVCTHTPCLNADITSGVILWRFFPPSSEQCCLLKLVLVFLIFIPCKCSRVPQDGTNNLL